MQFVLLSLLLLNIPIVDGFRLLQTYKKSNRNVLVLDAKADSKSKPFSIPIFNFGGNNKKTNSVKFQTVVIPPSYKLAAGTLSLSVLTGITAHNTVGGVLFLLLGILLLVQTTRVRFSFDDKCLEVLASAGVSKDTVGESGERLVSSGENFAVGGKNRWAYDTFTDWFFIPSKNFPVLMYFKENQTSPDGQLHLFPVIMSSKVLFDTMMERVGPAKQKK